MHVGVAVGCSRYDDPRVADLKYAHEDAARFAGTLTSVAGVPASAMVTLHDGVADRALLPTRSNVVRVLAGLPGALPDAVDTLHFFFSGHGYHSTTDGFDYFLTADSIGEALEETSLRFELVLRLLRRVRARHTLLYLDACRAATAGGKSTQAQTAAVRIENLCPSGMVSFCSCEPGAVSFEADELGGGVFSVALSKALSESGRCVTVQDLDDYLVAEVPALSRRVGKPVQRAHTRVEPLQVKDLEIVAPQVRNSWRTATRVGTELRLVRPLPMAMVHVSPLVAIDFGTSYSAIAVPAAPGKIGVVPGDDGRRLVPSVVSFTADLDYRVGAKAIEMEVHSPARTVRHSKRLIGSGRLVRVGDQSLAPEVVASLVIRSLKTTAEEALGSPVRRCLTAYPANFSTRQSNALFRAFEMADIVVERMIGEPNIAAMVLMAARPDLDATILIVDLGGGTFDAAVAEVGDGVCLIRAAAGSNELGGLDYDEAILGFARGRLAEQHGGLLLGDLVLAELRREAERAKRALGAHEETTIVVHDLETENGLEDIEVTLSRDDVRRSVRHLDDQIEQIVRSVIDDCAVKPEDVSIVMFSGQGGKIFTVREAVRAAGVHAEFVDQYQELAVVQGLAIQAGVLTGMEKQVVLMDLTHRGIGFRTQRQDTTTEGNFQKVANEGDHTEVIVARAATIPTKRSSKELIFHGGQDDLIGFAVVERSKVSTEDVVIGDIRFEAPGTEVHVQMTVDIDANSLIILTVDDLTNRALRFYQLNQYYRNAIYCLSDEDRIESLLDGWTIYPPRKLDLDTVTVDPPQGMDGPVSPNLIDWESELATWHAGTCSEQILAGRMLTRLNRASEAMTYLYLVIGDDGIPSWDIARKLCKATCETLEYLPEKMRDPVVTDMIRVLVRVLDQRPDSVQSRWHQSVIQECQECIEQIRRLGSFTQFGELEEALSRRNNAYVMP